MPKTESNIAKLFPQGGCTSVIVLVRCRMMPVEMRLLYFEPMTMDVDCVKCFKFRNDILIFHVAITV